MYMYYLLGYRLLGQQDDSTQNNQSQASQNEKWKHSPAHFVKGNIFKHIPEKTLVQVFCFQIFFQHYYHYYFHWLFSTLWFPTLPNLACFLFFISFSNFVFIISCVLYSNVLVCFFVSLNFFSLSSSLSTFYLFLYFQLSPHSFPADSLFSFSFSLYIYVSLLFCLTFNTLTHI